ncbi:hypothetical protein SKAU_G00272220 [Synaphobranchus kaupii]|uniref:Uncharacterized protein n=1 Tax=Synaphobranchus kaupii TaxID=118154 RepID=A0A9Q1F0J5_SYNKA|nr:hypothetical protein SKAU_G00272220 [Synaphobranchus kaupii]
MQASLDACMKKRGHTETRNSKEYWGGEGIHERQKLIGREAGDPEQVPSQHLQCGREIGRSEAARGQAPVSASLTPPPHSEALSSRLASRKPPL